MKIRRFFAPDMRRAIQLVRNEQGADAVILSSRSVDGGVEIVSAVDYDEALVAEMLAVGGRRETPAPAPAEPETASGAAAERPAPPPAEPRPAKAAPAARGRPADDGPARSRPANDAPARDRSDDDRPARDRATEDPALTAIRADLQAMKCLLREQFAQLASADREMLDPDRALLAWKVSRLKLEPELADVLVDEIEEPGAPTAWRLVMMGLATRLKIPVDDPLDEGGVFAFVGPTGVGKTTTIAKLAARHCLRYGRDSVALVSTDGFRVGAHRQLEAFGAILGVPVRTAATREELEDTLQLLRDRRLVLIDTAGIASRDRRLGDILDQLETGRETRRFLVLAANMQLDVMYDAVLAFGARGLAGTVLTKLDEANGLGAALSVLIQRRLPAVWLSDGQRVPEDLKVARIVHLLRWALKEPTLEPAVLPSPAVRGRRAAAREVMHAA
ncbi:MAG TPA: flagellar biosynthesis protein FlhF [Gammaproteobacteria bacterium]